MVKYDFDRPLEKEIKGTDQHLQRLKAKDPTDVFHCPVCNNDYAMLGNYGELKMCGKCYSKKNTEKMQKLADAIIGGTIEKVEVGETQPYTIVEKPDITKMRIKTTKGKVIELKVPERLIFA
jgi:hypothetical protein